MNSYIIMLDVNIFPLFGYTHWSTEYHVPLQIRFKTALVWQVSYHSVLQKYYGPGKTAVEELIWPPWIARMQNDQRELKPGKHINQS